MIKFFIIGATMFIGGSIIGDTCDMPFTAMSLSLLGIILIGVTPILVDILE